MLTLDLTLPAPLFAHQRSALETCAGKRAFALFDEQGLGKTATILANAALLYQRKAITGLLVVAPNDVHVQWVVEQIPLHWPTDTPYTAGYWRSGIGKRAHATLQAIALRACEGCPILTINYDALATVRAYKLCKLILTTGPCMLVADESHYIKTPNAARTKLMQRLAPLAYVRRIATGTPAETPFDYYSQMRFLQPQIWGCTPEGKPISKLEFKHRFAEFETNYVHQNGERREYEALIQYRDLDQLSQIMQPYMLRRTKDQCLDLPPKIYTRASTHLSPKQAQAYKQLKEQGMLILETAEKGGDVRDIGSIDDEELQQLLASYPQTNVVLPKIKLVMLLRLQQICGGHVTDNAGNVVQLEETFPRLIRTLEIIDGVLAKANGCADATGFGKPDEAQAPARSGNGADANERADATDGLPANAGQPKHGIAPRRPKAIVWAQRTVELNLLHARIAERYRPSTVAIYDGRTSPDQRLHLRTEFAKADSDLRVLCCHPQAAGTGLNLTAATTALYYTNGYSFIQRQQSEDRIHRIGTTGTVNVYDLCAEDAPVDNTVLATLHRKGTLANIVFNSTTEEWRNMI